MSETILIVDDEHRQPGKLTSRSERSRVVPSILRAAHLRTATARELYARCASMYSEAILLRQAMQPDGTW